MEKPKPSTTLHVDYRSVKDELFMSFKLDKIFQVVTESLYYSIEKGCLDESRKGGLRNSNLRKFHLSKQWKEPPASVIAFCITALIGLIPLVWYLLVSWFVGNPLNVSPRAVQLGLSSSINTFNELSRPSYRPQLIPRLIHQTFKSVGSLPEKAEQLRKSWKDKNPGWTLHLWDDDECKKFVKAEFPEYINAYTRLPKDVERADFFRYLVVFRLGGVYADIDTESIVSLEKVIRQSDTLVVGWEAEVPDSEAALRRHFSRVRQVGFHDAVDVYVIVHVDMGTNPIMMSFTDM